MEKRLFIYGAGGHAKTVISHVRTLGWQIAGVIDDGVPAGTLISGFPILGGAEQLPRLKEQGVNAVVNAVGGIGNYAVRWRIFERLLALSFDFPTIIHPTAWVEENVHLEDGVQVLAQSYISSESSVGFGTLINAGVIISHDCQIGKCVNLSPGAMLAGNVHLADFSQIGMGVTINLGVKVGSKARIGNAATVKADVPENGRVFAGSVWSIHNGNLPGPENLRKLA